MTTWRMGQTWRMGEWILRREKGSVFRLLAVILEGYLCSFARFPAVYSRYPAAARPVSRSLATINGANFELSTAGTQPVSCS